MLAAVLGSVGYGAASLVCTLYMSIEVPPPCDNVSRPCLCTSRWRVHSLGRKNRKGEIPAQGYLTRSLIQQILLYFLAQNCHGATCYLEVAPEGGKGQQPNRVFHTCPKHPSYQGACHQIHLVLPPGSFSQCFQCRVSRPQCQWHLGPDGQLVLGCRGLSRA